MVNYFDAEAVTNRLGKRYKAALKQWNSATKS